MDTVTKLNKIAELMAQADVLRLEKQKMLEEVVPKEVKDKIDEINAEFLDPEFAIQEKIVELEEQVKDEVTELGESVKSDHLHAVFTAGRITWDSKVLEGMMSLVPQIKQAQRVGKPSVSIRKIG